MEMGKSATESLQRVKEVAAEEVVLAIPTENGKFRVEADASEGR